MTNRGVVGRAGVYRDAMENETSIGPPLKKVFAPVIVCHYSGRTRNKIERTKK